MNKLIIILIASFVSAAVLNADQLNLPTHISPAVTVTLADRKLEAIIHAQNELIEDLQRDPNKFTENERDRRFAEIFKEYNTFIKENPNNVYASVLYGKLLRQVGLREDAIKVFMAVNQKNPNIAVVKQQIGNFLAEGGDYGLALPYFLSAIELEPKEPLYYYQLGELLSKFKDSFISSRILTVEEFDRQLLYAFDQARKIDSLSWIYQIRYAEAFYDLFKPDWSRVFEVWNGLEHLAPSIIEKELVLLNKARVLIKLERHEEARKCLMAIYRPELEKSRREILQLIPEPVINNQWF